MDPVHGDLAKMLAANQLEPFIRHIRFPHFRGLRDGTHVDFEHPVTALVGPNGTNKTAILRALQGAPENTNLGQYWFSTNLDPIIPEDRHRFIYGYLAQSVGEVVEVVKSRIAREGDPDYFEPARPILQDGMARMTPIPKGGPMPADRTATRWKTLPKNVVYLDFRSELSAYDKFFYHSPYRKGTTPATKKSHIRRRATYVSYALSGKVASHTFYQKERIISPAVSLSKQQVEAISLILGREYDSIDVLVHSYFDVPGATVVLKSVGVRYSEAFAGSGEFAVVMLVKAITDAEPRSLILLDEPEVSLHPGAQRQLMAFVAKQAKSKRHQVVVSTHAPAIVSDLPPSAIKVFLRSESDGKVDLVSQRTDPVDAFFRLGLLPAERWTVYVEDKLAASIVRTATRPLGEGPNSRLAIEVLPGGAGTIKSQFLPNLALTKRKRCLILLDGDQRPSTVLPDPSTLVEASIEGALGDALGVALKLPLDRGPGGVGTQKFQLQRLIMEWTYRNLDYLPGLNPEALLLDMEGHEGSPENGKGVWVERTKASLGLAEWEEVNANDILQEQYRALGKVDPKREELAAIRERVEKFLHGADE
ncbi:ATP-dependent endonuclease [Actinoplanes sp. NPDC049265]|uniref:ATP-dependent nuclease n=1 Tax=Actinoplanes sp. NPDC049265 TaxID=3363902 RepID=UPI003722948B